MFSDDGTYTHSPAWLVRYHPFILLCDKDTVGGSSPRGKILVHNDTSRSNSNGTEIFSLWEFNNQMPPGMAANVCYFPPENTKLQKIKVYFSQQTSCSSFSLCPCDSGVSNGVMLRSALLNVTGRDDDRLCPHRCLPNRCVKMSADVVIYAAGLDTQNYEA